MKEILIRLEDELYEQCKNTKLTEENEGFDFHIIKSVANGTVLPKGHGRLIDAEKLKKDYPYNTDWDYPVNTNSYVVESIDNAPTIIEAGKGE